MRPLPDRARSSTITIPPEANRIRTAAAFARQMIRGAPSARKTSYSWKTLGGGRVLRRRMFLVWSIRIVQCRREVFGGRNLALRDRRAPLDPDDTAAVRALRTRILVEDLVLRKFKRLIKRPVSPQPIQPFTFLLQPTTKRYGISGRNTLKNSVLSDNGGYGRSNISHRGNPFPLRPTRSCSLRLWRQPVPMSRPPVTAVLQLRRELRGMRHKLVGQVIADAGPS
jgi:hypothetical protein